MQKVHSPGPNLNLESLALSGTKCIPEKKLQMSASVSVTQYVRVLHFFIYQLDNGADCIINGNTS